MPLGGAQRQFSTFLNHELLPYAAAEEASLYRLIGGLVGPGATRTMALDHAAIAGLVPQLGVATDGGVGRRAQVEAQRILLGVEALVTTHLWKEDTAYLPLLRRLDPRAYTALHAQVAGHSIRPEHTLLETR